MVMYNRVKKRIVNPIKEMISDEYFTEEEFCSFHDEDFKHYQIGNLHIKLMKSCEERKESYRYFYYFYITAPGNQNLKECYIKYDEDADEGVSICSKSDEIFRRFPAYDDFYFRKEPEIIKNRITDIVSEFEKLVQEAQRIDKGKKIRRGMTRLERQDQELAIMQNGLTCVDSNNKKMDEIKTS